MTGHSFNWIHRLSVWRAVFKGNGRECTVKITLQLGSVVRGAMVVDRKHRIAIGAHNGYFGAHRDSYKPLVISEHTRELGAGMINHRALPQMMSGFIHEKRRASPTVDIRAKSAG
jgi:hypothetical protein